jgi:CRISPR-associated endonuclease Csn1
MRQSADMPPYVLGLDLGSASLGWALIALDSQHNPAELTRAGVRIFQPGVEGSALDIERGKDQSRAVMRREARLHRRQLRRRAARQRDLFKLLQHHRFLPGGPDADNSASSEQRHSILNALDKELTKCLLANAANDPVAATRISQSLPYQLRKAALDRKLEPQELGRVLYHLIQRRGFKSNRREGKKGKEKEEELGKVKAGISELEQKMVSSGARTLGDYFAGLDPHQQKVRRIWTARRMFEEEFEKIWTVQQAHAPQLLTAELKAEIAHLLFYQRPIASQEHLIGRCELEPDERRAPWATLEAQQFRVLQKVNDLKVVVPGSLDDQPLTTEDREKVYLALQSEGDKTFAALRKLLRLPRSQFNLERGGEKNLRGNRTNQHMRSVFAARWEDFSPEEKRRAVEVWRTTEDRDTLVKVGMESWGLDELAATRWADKYPEDGYCSLSLKAIRKLLRRMEAGMPFKTAEKEVYGERFSGQEPKDFLPTVHAALPTLRNPAVERAVTEMRKVVNAIVREYGRPYEIRLEMARELRKSRKEREAITKTNRNRQREKEQTKARLLRECGIQNPSPEDIEKALLFEECGGICPYTGRTIEFSALFGDSQFDVEHIIPLSRYPDDSFLNKTLCYHEENRNMKRGRTPWEAYGADEERWAAVLARVEKFNNPAKFTRFKLRTQEELQEFTQRQMNDTRYTTRLAADLLGTLYGGRDETLADGSKRRAIFATSGQVTATLRRVWKLESILREALPSSNGESRGKPRTDHRHHAIDAIVVALTSEKTVKLLSTAAAQAPEWQLDRRVFRRIESPWPNFVDSIRPHIEQMVVSHRPEHKMSGALHDETNYGRPYLDGKKTYVHIRKPITSLTAKELSSIIDPVVMAAVQQKAEALGGDLSKCESAGDWPLMPAKDGRSLPIRRVRIRKVLEVTPIAEGVRQRFVAENSIHHFELFVRRDGRKETWCHTPVTLYEAFQRQRRGGDKDIVCHVFAEQPDAEFLCSLMKGDTIEIDYKGRRQVFRVKKFYAAGSIWLTDANNAQKDDEQKRDKTRWSKTPNELKALKPCKVVVDLLGRVHPAND